MSVSQKFIITLTPELATEIQSAVKQGCYANVEELIGEAVRDWYQIRRERIAATEGIREAWNKGLSSGEGQYETMEDIKQVAKNSRLR